MRFVQVADVHIDSYVSGALGLSPEKVKALAGDIRTAFARACALAVDRKADCVLIPGDLFDYETADAGTYEFVSRTLASIAPIPVFIAPGNHDSLRAGSPYLGEWPGNVHVFTSAEFAPSNEFGAMQPKSTSVDWSVTGIAHAHRGITERALARRIALPDAPIRILLFHGSRDGYKPSDKETVIPFSDAELIGQGFTYAAIGHYHSFGAITDEKGGIRGAYSGCAQGRGLDETGEKCAVVGQIGPDGRVELERVEVAPRRIVKVEVSISGARDASEVFARIDEAVRSRAREDDVVYVSLVGTLALGVEIDASIWQSRQPYFAAVVDASRIEPDYDLQAISRDSAASSIKSAFVRKMLERQEQARSEHPELVEGSDERLAVLRDAVYYGLYALDKRKLEPRDAD